jgi:hypothetical protein
MGIKLGDISPFAGAVSGKGLFGGLRKVTPAMMVIDAMRDKKKKPAGAGGRPMAEEVMVAEEAPAGATMRKGGKVKKMAKGGSTASKRGDGCATKGKTKGRFV